MQLNAKPKSEYSVIHSRINYLDQRYRDLPNRHFGKYRYLKVDAYPYPFELFIGKETGDFKPKFENIDALAVGDTVSIYGYQTPETEKEGINQHVQFIEKDGVLFFERGNAYNIIGISLIFISIGLSVFCFIQWKRGIIPY